MPGRTVEAGPPSADDPRRPSRNMTTGTGAVHMPEIPPKDKRPCKHPHIRLVLQEDGEFAIQCCSPEGRRVRHSFTKESFRLTRYGEWITVQLLEPESPIWFFRISDLV